MHMCCTFFGTSKPWHFSSKQKTSIKKTAKYNWITTSQPITPLALLNGIPKRIFVWSTAVVEHTHSQRDTRTQLHFWPSMNGGQSRFLVMTIRIVFSLESVMLYLEKRRFIGCVQWMRIAKVIFRLNFAFCINIQYFSWAEVFNSVYFFVSPKGLKSILYLKRKLGNVKWNSFIGVRFLKIQSFIVWTPRGAYISHTLWHDKKTNLAPRRRASQESRWEAGSRTHHRFVFHKWFSKQTTL